MTKINTTQALESLFQKIGSLESLVQQNSQLLKKSFSIGKEHHLLFSHGIEGYKEKILSELKEKISPKDRLYALARQDKSLRYPHKKILDFLIGLYDYQQGRFREAHFSRIVRECKLGKNKAKEYFGFLIKKGFIEYRTDGYRKFYRITLKNT